MMGNSAGQKTGQQLDMAIANAIQTIRLLQSQIEAGELDKDYLKERLASLSRLLENLADERRRSDQKARLAALYEVSKVIGSSLDLETVLNQVMDAIIRLTGAERGFLMLMDDDGNLEVKVARNFEREQVQDSDLAVSRTITRQVVDTGQPVVTTNALEDPRFSQQESVITHNLRSILCTPLRARGKIIGVVYVDNRIRSGIFSEQDLEMLDAFASQAAVSIENARLFTTTDQALAERVEELTMLQRIDRQLNETLELDKALSLTLEWAVRVTGAQSGSVGLLDEESGGVRLLAHYGESDSQARKEWECDDAIVEKVMEAGAPTTVTLQRDGSTYTRLAVPVRRERKVIGLIVLTKLGDDAFDDEARQFVSRLADRAAIAIDNARLFTAVKAANDAKSEFVSVVSHELKIPMTSILGYADMLLKGIVGPINEQQTQFLEVIRNNVQRMQVLVSDLSDISRIESGRLYIEIEDVDVPQIVDRVREATIRQIEERKHTLIVEMEPGLPKVKADPKRLEQVMINLLSNAYKYTPDGGRITVRAWRRGDRVAISVSDTGVGMTEEEIANLGKKFWRADNPHVTSQPGTGLGFAITRNLIELMDGELTIESEPGKGSTFTFTLPVA